MWRHLALAGLEEVVVDEPPNIEGQWTCLGLGNSASTPLQNEQEVVNKIKIFTLHYFV